MSDKKCKLCKLRTRHHPECKYCDTCCSVLSAYTYMDSKKRKRWIDKLGKIIKKG